MKPTSQSTLSEEKEPALPDGPVRVLVSACLLGKKVRYNGGHKRDPIIVETLGRFFEYVPVCPEVECGLPTPREAMKLAGDPAHPRLVTVNTGADHTRKMRDWIRRKLKDLKILGLRGYICKGKSPSCAMDGMFTVAFKEHFPRIPVEEEGRLQDPALRANFVQRVLPARAGRTGKSGR
jgi:uncharacterized protein YbbK (DUF523 family)